MKNIKAVLLAAGESSRFYPFNKSTHKTMVKLMGKPLIVHTVESIKRAKINNLIVVISPGSEIKKVLGNGDKFGVSINYVTQNTPNGMGEALLASKNYIESDFFLLNASHLDFDSFAEKLFQAKQKGLNGVILAKKNKIGENQGIFRLSGKSVLEIVEKPKKGSEPSDMSVVGIYLFDKSFLDYLERVPKEHYSFEKAISEFAKKNIVEIVEAKKVTVSLKYPWDLLKVKDYIFEGLKRKISPKAKIAKSAEIIGEVVIEEGVRIMEGVRIKGPCFINRNSIIGNNSILRNGMDIGESCVVGGYMEMKNTILMEKSTTHSGFIGDCVIGENCRIAAQFCTGNLRLDRSIIYANILEKKVETGLKFLGAIIGANCNIGIKVSTMPGVIIGRNSTIGPSTVVMKNVPDNVRYYTKFQEVVVKNEK